MNEIRKFIRFTRLFVLGAVYSTAQRRYNGSIGIFFIDFLFVISGIRYRGSGRGENGTQRDRQNLTKSIVRF